MKKALAVQLIVLAWAICATAQPPAADPAPAPQGQQHQQADLNQIVEQVQRIAMATNGDIGKLRIEKWRTDGDQKAQLQKVADSLQRNITYAVPGLITDVQESHGSVSSTFRLYHNLNVVYEFLISLADAAGNLGKREEYEPLAADAAALDSARTSLSQYIEQAAASYESRVRAQSPPPEEAPAPVRIIVDDAPAKPAKHTKKTTSKHHPEAKPSPSPK
jgi:hypothetical protein